MNLEDSILRAIRDQLPESVAGELKAFIDQAQADGDELYDLRIERDELKKELEREKSEHLQLKMKESDLRRREQELAELRVQCTDLKRALDKNLALVELKDQLIDREVSGLKEVVLGFCANNRFKYSERARVPIPIEGMPAGKDEWGNPQPGNLPYVATGESEKEVEGES